MNILLDIGLLLILGYASGWLLNKIGLPKIVGYILVGVALSPDTYDVIGHESVETTEPLMAVCLAFIAFEVGGSLKWSRLKKHGDEIVKITIFASLLPFILISLAIFAFGFFFPERLPFGTMGNLSLALLLGILASPTAPAATLAVIHQYKAKGKVTDTILGVVALDDALGIIMFSIVLSVLSMINGVQGFIGSSLMHSAYEISVSVLLGVIMALVMKFSAKIFQIKNDGQWIVIIASLLILCVGISKLLGVGELLACMTMGMMTANKNSHYLKIFKVIEQYTEEFVFLIFFLLSGLHLNISTIPQTSYLIGIFVVFRIAGKYLGASVGARMAKGDVAIRKYTAGGLLPQAGIVIGLVLSIYGNEEFKEISEILLATIMGTTVINELIGPVITKYSLRKAGEIDES
jgi:Kef-type K+ transport system membrane component KefB